MMQKNIRELQMKENQKESIKKQINSCSIQTLNSQQQLMRKIEEQESNYYSKNQLNLAFIADTSKDIQSISIAGSASQRQSISSISRVASNAGSIPPGSPFLTFQPEISSMEEWSKESPDVFGNKQLPSFNDFRKRVTRNSIPEPIQQINQQDRQLQKISKCTKKRIGEKNKVITIQPSSTSNQYGLRSKAKNNSNSNLSNENDSSSEELRQMVAQIGSKKTIQKNLRKMLPQ